MDILLIVLINSACAIIGGSLGFYLGLKSAIKKGMDK